MNNKRAALTLCVAGLLLGLAVCAMLAMALLVLGLL